jgi:hypothetical protein
MGFLEWIQVNWFVALGGVYAILSAIGQWVGMFDGPDPDDKTSKTLGIVNMIMGWLRTIGIGTYKNEPGTGSIPFKGDTGKRV